MIPDLINKFRSMNGVGPVQNWDSAIGMNCNRHCLAMMHSKNCYHADPCYLNGCGEAVAIMTYNDWWQDQVIFDMFGPSEEHRKMLLESTTMGYGYQINNYVVYITIRGK